MTIPSSARAAGGGEALPSSPAVGSFFAGRYRLLLTLGRGGMADVFLATAQGPAGFHKLVVVKKLREARAFDPSFVAMFLDEARLAARLNHPNVVHTYEVGEEGDGYFIAMEYLEGQPLNRIVSASRARGELLDPALVAHVLGEALLGLHYAHEMRDFDGTPLGIVHRDVSPQNVFVTYEGQVKVLDFGIAKASLNVSETQAGLLKGKFSYMAPEQASGAELDRRADVFAAGILLWELLTGERLYKGDGAVALHKLLNVPVPRPSEKNPGVDARLEAITLKALAREPDQRFATAQEMANALFDWVAGVGKTIRQRDVAARMEQLFAATRAEVQRQVRAAMDAPTSNETSHVARMGSRPSYAPSGVVERPAGMMGPGSMAPGSMVPGSMVPGVGGTAPGVTASGVGPVGAGVPGAGATFTGTHPSFGTVPSVTMPPPGAPVPFGGSLLVQPPPSRMPWLVGGLALLLLGAGAGAFLALRSPASSGLTASAKAEPEKAKPAASDAEAFHLTLSSTPLEAQVEWAGKPVGQTPLMIDLLPGPQTFTLTKDGYFTGTVVVNVTEAMAGQTQSRTVVLVARDKNGKVATLGVGAATPATTPASAPGMAAAAPNRQLFAAPAPARPGPATSHTARREEAAAPSSAAAPPTASSEASESAASAIAQNPPAPPPQARPEAAPAVAGTPQVLPFGPEMTRPQLLSGSDPVPTREALLAGVEGVMIAKCTITTAGALESCRIIKGLPHMDKALLDSLATRRYAPVTYKGKPVAVEYVFNVRLVKK